MDLDQVADGANQQRPTRNLAAGSQPDWSPDGTQVAFVSFRSGSADIYVMNVDGSDPQRLTLGLAGDFEPDWSPDGTQIAFASQVGDFDGGGQRRLTRNDAEDGAPRWSPDGAQIAFESDRDGNSEIYVMNIADTLQSSDGSNVRRLTDAGAYDGLPAWKP